MASQLQNRPATPSPLSSPHTSSKHPSVTFAPFLPTRRKTMSVAQTLNLAHLARAKLSTEANRSDHDLRLLVGHANLLDSLMLELAEAGREQETWFNQSIADHQQQQQQQQQQQYHQQQQSEAAVDEDDDTTDSDDDDWAVESESESESEPETEGDDEVEYEGEDEKEDEDEDDIEMAGTSSVRKISAQTPAKPVQRQRRTPLVASRPTATTTITAAAAAGPYEQEHDEDLFMMDEDEDYADLRLARVSSHSLSPPELDHDADTSEDEAMPPSPATDLIALPDNAKPDPDGSEQEEEARYQSFYAEGYYVPPRNPTRLVPAYATF